MSPATATAPARHRPSTAPVRPRQPFDKQAPQHKPAPRRPDLYVVEPTKPSRSAQKKATSKGRLGIVAVGLVFLVAFAIAILQTVIVQSQMHLDDLQQQISDTQAEAQRLQLEAADLSSPTHIVEQAEAMGMVAAPEGVEFIPTVDGDTPAPLGVSEVPDPTPSPVEQVASPAAEAADETAAAPTP